MDDRPVSQRKPPWLRVRVPGDGQHAAILGHRRRQGLATVCEEALCPNRAECWSCGTATFMVLGSVCTRGCRFCAVDAARHGQPLDPDEPDKLARTVAELALRYAVITSVTRDDLDDHGAAHLAACVRALRRDVPDILVEVLIPDLGGDRERLATVAAAGPVVLGHNLEVVRRLSPLVRHRAADHDRSLAVLRTLRDLADQRLAAEPPRDLADQRLADEPPRDLADQRLAAEPPRDLADQRLADEPPRQLVKSALLVGLGETDAEVDEALAELRDAGCQMLAVGQYLQPSRRHWPVAQYREPAWFDDLADRARGLGFSHVAAGPLVRSSYRASELFVTRTLSG